MSAYYNEFDPFAAAWLRELIADNLIAPGEVDERSIEDVKPDDLRPFQQIHFFAGIGVWSLAARLAGIPDDFPLWTGSCPCQPFSAAGKGGGFDDERHLWPAMFHLVDERRPVIIVGEQVARKDGDAWLDLVSVDMEAAGYAFGAVETVACGFGAPHMRARNYWMAHRIGARLEGLAGHGNDRYEPRRERADEARSVASGGDVDGMADAYTREREQLAGEGARPVEAEGRRARDQLAGRRYIDGRGGGRPGPVNGFWRYADWLRCRDEKWRAVEPGTFPLADAGAFRNRVGLLRGAGNAVTIGQAVGWLEAVAETVGIERASR